MDELHADPHERRTWPDLEYVTTHPSDVDPYDDEPLGVPITPREALRNRRRRWRAGGR